MSEKRKIVQNVLTELDDLGRKKFTIAEHSQSQQEQTPAIVEIGRHQSMLVSRQASLNIEKYIGRIDKNKKKVAKQIFYCEVCKEGFKCDMAYLTHCNSPQHNRKLGMNMKVKSVSAAAIAEKLSNLRNEATKFARVREQAVDKLIKNSSINQPPKYNEKKQQQAQLNEKPASQVSQHSAGQDIEAMLQQYGLPSSFGSKKQKH